MLLVARLREVVFFILSSSAVRVDGKQKKVQNRRRDRPCSEQKWLRMGSILPSLIYANQPQGDRW